MIQRILVLGVLLTSSTFAVSQVAPDANAGTVPLALGGSFSYFDASYASNRVAGLSSYIDYSPLLAGNLGVEGEGRWMTMGGSHGFNEYNYLVGPRYRFFLSDRYQPYAKVLLGAGEINFPYSLAHGGYFAWAPGGGIDIGLSRRWAARADYEFQIWPSAPGIPGIPNGSFHPNGVTVGVSYRLFRPRYELAGQ